ncbi:hypothetical protein ACHAWF_007412, partial [Thalassiosira exigua]
SGLTNPSDEQRSFWDLLSMDQVLLCGLAELEFDDCMAFARHCVDRKNWARGRGKRKVEELMGDVGAAAEVGEGAGGVAGAGATATGAASASASGAAGAGIVPGRSFAVLVPGVDGVVGDAKFLRGKTFLLSGTFPEAGGGGGADAAGAANVKAMIESFGGRVASRFSKKTDFLLVGKDAVPAKFKDARKRSVQILSLRRLQGLLLGHVSFEGLGRLPPLTGDMFAAGAYQPAGAPPSMPAKTKPAAVKPPLTKSPEETPSAEKKPAAAAKGPGKAPSAAKAVPACGATSEVAVAAARAPVASSAVVPHSGKSKAKFVVPRPGVNGAIPGVLDGKRLVLTGGEALLVKRSPFIPNATILIISSLLDLSSAVFPELGGGTGLSLGKDRTKAMIESFGGRVTSSVSGKTDFLVVGKEPGRSKVSQADKRGLPMLDLLSLRRVLTGGCTLEGAKDEPPPRIETFSAGYPGQRRIGY